MLTSSHFYTWRNKLKTGLYYLKTQPAVSALDFGLDAETIIQIETRRNIIPNEKNNENESFINQMNNISPSDACGGACQG